MQTQEIDIHIDIFILVSKYSKYSETTPSDKEMSSLVG